MKGIITGLQQDYTSMHIHMKSYSDAVLISFTPNQQSLDKRKQLARSSENVDVKEPFSVTFDARPTLYSNLKQITI